MEGVEDEVCCYGGWVGHEGLVGGVEVCFGEEAEEEEGGPSRGVV